MCGSAGLVGRVRTPSPLTRGSYSWQHWKPEHILSWERSSRLWPSPGPQDQSSGWGFGFPQPAVGQGGGGQAWGPRQHQSRTECLGLDHDPWGRISSPERATQEPQNSEQPQRQEGFENGRAKKNSGHQACLGSKPWGFRSPRDLKPVIFLSVPQLPSLSNQD